MTFDSSLLKGSTAPIVLRLLAEQERYGYEIARLVNERTNGALQWKEGTLYPCLHALEGKGLIRGEWREAPSGKRRRYYHLTRRGRAELARKTEEWRAFRAAVDTLLFAVT